MSDSSGEPIELDRLIVILTSLGAEYQEESLKLPGKPSYKIHHFKRTTKDSKVFFATLPVGGNESLVHPNVVRSVFRNLGFHPSLVAEQFDLDDI